MAANGGAERSAVETSRPAYGEAVIDVYHRREPWFSECSTHQFMNYVEATRSLAVLTSFRSDAMRFFKHITGVEPDRTPNITSRRRSYFLSLTFPNLVEALPHLEKMSEGVDAIEVRADLLRAAGATEPKGYYIPAVSYVADQVAALRRATPLPLVYTVRTMSQGGAFPDNAPDEVYKLLALALRMGIAYIDIEVTLPAQYISELHSRKGFSQFIASWHDWNGDMKWDSPIAKEKCEIAHKTGDIVKIVGKAGKIQDNFTLYDFVAKYTDKLDAKPIIAINMGPEGQMSRILNHTLTPVTHRLLPFQAAPGQLPFTRIQTALNTLGLLPSLRFFLFGRPIKHSMSPALHNTGFEVLGLPHTYQLFETESVNDEIGALLSATDFGGASVTIPYKIEVMPLLGELTAAAKSIGAVNTIIPVSTDAGRKLVGDNTDWIGIYKSILSLLPMEPIRAGLVIGAGGTARAAVYALSQLGAKYIYVYNRTKVKALELSRTFPAAPVFVIDRLGEWPAGSPPPNAIIGTIPADATTLAAGGNGLHLTPELFEYKIRPAVVVDMAYRPAETPLLRLAKATGSNWVTVPGIEVLLEQGYAQFEVWTGRKFPYSSVAPVVRERYYATE